LKPDVKLLRDKLEEFLKKARWWPAGVSEYEVLEELECSSGALFLIKAGNKLYQLPLVRAERVDERVIKSGRFVKVDGELYVEAEYTPLYFSFMNCIGAEHEDLKALDVPVTAAEPLEMESTNVTALQTLASGLKLVVKSYRALARVNLEPLMYRELNLRRYPYIPELYRIYMIKLGGEIYYLSIVTKYVEGKEGDGGAPFYRALKAVLERERGKRLSVSEAYLPLLAAKVAHVMATMHCTLNPDFSQGFLGLEHITKSDVKSWARRIRYRFSEVHRALDERIADSRRRVKVEYEFWKSRLNSVEQLIEDSANAMLELFSEGFKGRIHQDLHLGQMIYVPRDGEGEFYITDLEGEPMRSDEEKLVKEPLIRDLATMSQSFYYLAFTTLLEASQHRKVRSEAVERGERWYEEEFLRLSKIGKRLIKQKNPAIHSWVSKHVSTLAYIYARATSPEIIKRDMFGYRHPLERAYYLYMSPWIVERALYEALYELTYSESRPGWFIIPLSSLINPPIPLILSTKAKASAVQAA